MVDPRREATDHEHNGHAHEHAEGYHGWIGSMKTSEGLTDLSQLDKEDVDRALGISSLSLSEPEWQQYEKSRFRR